MTRCSATRFYPMNPSDPMQRPTPDRGPQDEGPQRLGLIDRLAASVAVFVATGVAAAIAWFLIGTLLAKGEWISIWPFLSFAAVFGIIGFIAPSRTVDVLGALGEILHFSYWRGR